MLKENTHLLTPHIHNTVGLWRHLVDTTGTNMVSELSTSGRCTANNKPQKVTLLYQYVNIVPLNLWIQYYSAKKQVNIVLFTISTVNIA